MKNSSVLVLLLLSSIFFGQKKILQLDYRNSVDGLSSDWVNSLAEDNQGFIWLGTRHGLNIYDGKEFNSLFHRENDSTTLSGNDVSVVIKSRSGHIIAGTWGKGINIVNPITKQITKPKKDGVSEKLNVKSIVETNDSIIYVGTWGNGFFKYNKEKNILQYCSYIPENNEKKLLFDECEGMCVHKNQIFVTSPDGGLGTIDPKTNNITKYKPNKQLIDSTDKITALNSNDKNLLIGTNNSFYIEFDTDYNITRFSTNISKGLKDSARISSILVDHKKNSWITSAKGVTLKEIQSQLTTNYVSSINHQDDIYCSLEDSRGVIWFGNWGSGLSKYEINPKKFLETDPGGINEWHITSISSYDKGHLIVSTSKGTYLFNKKTEKLQKPELSGNQFIINKILDGNILNISPYKNNSYLVQIEQHGLYIIDENLHVSKHPFSHPLISEKATFNFLSVDNQKIWLGTKDQGVILYDDQTKQTTHYLENGPNKIISNHIHSIYIDKTNKTWLCTEAGVMNFDSATNKFIAFTKIKLKGIKSILQDEDRIYWFSSPEGLISYNASNNSSSLIRKENDQNNQAMSNIFKIGDHIWGTVNDGSYSLNVKTKKGKHHFKTDGAKITTFEQSLVYEDNKIYLNYSNGIESLDPKELIEDKVSLKLYVQKFLVNDIEKRASDIDQKITEMDHINLENDENNISIVLSIIDFRKSKHDAFTHQLIGFDDKPIIHDSQHKRIKYTNLDPGKYELIISSIDSKNKDSKFKKTITISIERPIWEKWWFILSVILFTLIAIYLFSKYRTYAIEKKNKELVKYAEEKNAEAKQKNLELTNTYDELARKDKHLNNNVNYASVIQNTLLPNSEEVTNIFPKSFIIFRPRDVVSGDFYCSIKVGDTKIFVVADCTGHGVSGAFISVLGITYIKSIVYGMGITEPDQILNRLHLEITRSLRQKTSNIKDGMDITVICHNENTKNLAVSSAQGLMLIAEDGEELIQVKGDKYPIGGSTNQYTHRKDFTLNKYKLQKRTMLYLFSDGYQDQFGGPENRKFMKGRFRKLLVANSNEQLEKQKNILEKNLDDWQQDKKQTDDILVVGIEIS